MSAVQRYQQRISGPLMDRIDIQLQMVRVPFQKLASLEAGESSSAIRARVETAPKVQEHFGAESMIVATVTTGPKHLQNRRQVCVRAGVDHRFWFTTFPELTVATVLTGPIWALAGMGMRRQRLLPDHSRRD